MCFRQLIFTGKGDVFGHWDVEWNYSWDLLKEPPAYGPFTGPQMKELLNIKQSLGFVDPRYGMKECELCDTGEWRLGTSCAVPPKQETSVGYDAEAEKAVQAITDQILAQMK